MKKRLFLAGFAIAGLGFATSSLAKTQKTSIYYQAPALNNCIEKSFEGPKDLVDKAIEAEKAKISKTSKLVNSCAEASVGCKNPKPNKGSKLKIFSTHWSTGNDMMSQLIKQTCAATGGKIVEKKPTKAPKKVASYSQELYLVNKRTGTCESIKVSGPKDLVDGIIASKTNDQTFRKVAACPFAKKVGCENFSGPLNGSIGGLKFSASSWVNPSKVKSESKAIMKQNCQKMNGTWNG